jgi:hypothetical protein
VKGPFLSSRRKAEHSQSSPVSSTLESHKKRSSDNCDIATGKTADPPAIAAATVAASMHTTLDEVEMEVDPSADMAMNTALQSKLRVNGS